MDKDKGVNGQVRYSIVQQPNQKGTKFNVDEETGELFTNKVFDREGEDGKQVRVESFGPILSFGQLAHFQHLIDGIYPMQYFFYFLG